MYPKTVRKITKKDMALWSDYEKQLQELEDLKKSGEFKGRSREFIAKKLKISIGKIGQIEYIRKHGSSQIKAAVANGEMTISAARVMISSKKCSGNDEPEQTPEIQNLSNQVSPELSHSIKASKLKEFLDRAIDTSGDTDIAIEVFNDKDLKNLSVSKVTVLFDSGMILEDDIEAVNKIKLIIRIKE